MLHLPVSCFGFTPAPRSIDTSKLLDRKFFSRFLFSSALGELLLSLFPAPCEESFPLVDDDTLDGLSSPGSLLITCAEEAREEMIDMRSVLEQMMPVDDDGLGGVAEDPEEEGGTCSEALRLGWCGGCVGTKSEYRRDILVVALASALEEGPADTW